MKAGKTTLASKFPRSLLIGFERGWSAIPGIKAVGVDRWSDFRKLVNQLKTDEVKELYDNIIIDTGDIAFIACEKYVFNREGVDGYSGIPYGAGYAMVGNEFDAPFREIQNMGYGLIIISHAKEKMVDADTPQEHMKWMPTMSKRGFDVVSKLTDIISYIATRDMPVDPNDPTKGVREERFMFMRDTKQHFAGSRFKYMPPVVRLGFDHLVEAMHSAIDKEAAETDNEYVTEKLDESRRKAGFEDRPFDEIKQEVMTMANTIFRADQTLLQKITSISEGYLGKGKKIDGTTPDQKGMLELISADLKELLEEVLQKQESAAQAESEMVKDGVSELSSETETEVEEEE